MPDADIPPNRVHRTTKEEKRAVIDEATANTPEGEEVVYPPLSVSADRLRELANSAAGNEGWIDAECRAEA